MMRNIGQHKVLRLYYGHKRLTRIFKAQEFQRQMRLIAQKFLCGNQRRTAGWLSI